MKKLNVYIHYLVQYCMYWIIKLQNNLQLKALTLLLKRQHFNYFNKRHQYFILKIYFNVFHRLQLTTAFKLNLTPAKTY